MSDGWELWTWRLLNDPIEQNPWSFGLMVVLAVLTLTGFVLVIWKGPEVFRRREREMDDRAEADRILAGARAPRALSEVTTETRMVRPEVQPRYEPDDHPRNQPPERRVVHADDRAVVSVQDTGAQPARHERGVRSACAVCEGRGFVMRRTSEVLGESLGLLGDGADVVIREFYSTLLAADEGRAEGDRLAPLFPSDILAADAIHGQRDKLLAALLDLSKLYNPDDPDSLERLNTALVSMGNRHATFLRPDGSVRGATFDEYAAVKKILFATLHAAAGTAWKPEYDHAWSEAYDYAAARMLVAAQEAVLSAGFSTPRYPREARG